MSQSDVTPSRRRAAGPLFAVAVVLLVGGATCGCYSLIKFVELQAKKSEFEAEARARQDPRNRELENLRMVFGGLSGMGPLGMNIAATAVILDLEKDAWKYLSFALLLGLGGLLLLRATRRNSSHAGFRDPASE
jgi:hypothetical protein